MIWWLVSLFTAGQVQLESFYNRSSRTVKLGSSFDFSWNYTGDLGRVEWGTKDRQKIAIDVLLFVLDVNGRLTPNVPQYNKRRFGNWSQQSPGQVIFTLSPIKEVDNQVFIFRFVSDNPAASDVFDIVQLIVKGKNFYYLINFCFIMEGNMKFQNGQVMPLNFNNSERKWLQFTPQTNKVCHEKWCCGFALKRAVVIVSSLKVLVMGKFKCMKTQS